MKNLLLLLVVFCSLGRTYAQENTSDQQLIKQTIIGFLNWYKENNTKLILTEPIIEETKTSNGTSLKINFKGVDSYLNQLNNSKLVSDIYLYNLKKIYEKASEGLKGMPENYNGAIPGLETDLILGFDKEDILNKIDKGKFKMITIADNKALVRFNIQKSYSLVFTLTKHLDQWLIDH